MTKLLSVDDVAKILGVSPYTVRRWSGERRLRKIKLGSRTLFDPADIKQLIKDAKNAANAPRSAVARPEAAR